MKFEKFKRVTFYATLAVGLLATGCTHKKHQDPMASVAGVAKSSALTTLGPNAVAYVRLADVTKDGVQGKTVLQDTFKPCCDSMPFELRFKSKQIDPKHDYALDVRVVEDGKLVLISRGGQRVLTKGNPSQLSVDLERAGAH